MKDGESCKCMSQFNKKLDTLRGKIEQNQDGKDLEKTQFLLENQFENMRTMAEECKEYLRKGIQSAKKRRREDDLNEEALKEVDKCTVDACNSIDQALYAVMQAYISFLEAVDKQASFEEQTK